MTSSTAADLMPDEFDPASVRSALEQRFERLLADHGSALARLAGSYAERRSDRDDLLQEVAMAIWQALPAFRGDCSERTFVFRIAHNRAITWLARHRARRAAQDDVPDRPDSRPDPEAVLVRNEQGGRLAAAVRTLPLPYRQVVTLTLEQMDYGEIAQVLGITESNVGVRLNRARQMLRRIMESSHER